MALRDAVVARSEAERSVKAAVDQARAHGYPWELIGSLGRKAGKDSEE